MSLTEAPSGGCRTHHQGEDMINHCESGACIEVANHDGHIRIRSTVTGTVMQCTPAEWEGFLTDLADGKWAHIGDSLEVTV